MLSIRYMLAAVAMSIMVLNVYAARTSLNIIKRKESVDGKCFCVPLNADEPYYEADECKKSCKDGYSFVDIDNFYSTAQNTINEIKLDLIKVAVTPLSIVSKVCDFSFLQLKLDCTLDNFTNFIQATLQTKKIKEYSEKEKSIQKITKDYEFSQSKVEIGNLIENIADLYSGTEKKFDEIISCYSDNSCSIESIIFRAMSPILELINSIVKAI
ncbi:hypothetical protein AYI69_g465 [Smittium culicis]|uniref:Uncharacterized protein n=1 Tax=Smittium culicis TaxID=133412 RepID=A0A1R1YSY5_9FUNG|nr:hypothetical protein AYI69_g465 [Smittium culicis]